MSAPSRIAQLLVKRVDEDGNITKVRNFIPKIDSLIEN